MGLWDQENSLYAGIKEYFKKYPDAEPGISTTPQQEKEWLELHDKHNATPYATITPNKEEPAAREAFGQALMDKDFERAKIIAASFSLHANDGWLYKEAFRLKEFHEWAEINDFMKSEFRGWNSWLATQQNHPQE